MALNWNSYENEPCYICGRKLGKKTPHTAYLQDDDQGAVFVGMECIKTVSAAGRDGVKSRKGKGPRVFASPELAREWLNQGGAA